MTPSTPLAIFSMRAPVTVSGGCCPWVSVAEAAIPSPPSRRRNERPGDISSCDQAANRVENFGAGVVLAEIGGAAGGLGTGPSLRIVVRRDVDHRGTAHLGGGEHLGQLDAGHAAEL